MDKWLNDLFINEAKPALERHSGGGVTKNRLKEFFDSRKCASYFFWGYGKVQGYNVDKDLVDVSEHISYDDTENVTNFDYFAGNRGLEYNGSANQNNQCCVTNIPMLNTSKGKTFRYAFYYTKIEFLPVSDTSQATDLTYMCGSGYQLKTVPSVLDLSNCSTINGIFQYCRLLEKVSFVNTTKLSNIGSAFNGCRAIHTIETLDLRNVTSNSSAFNSCQALTNLKLLNIKKSLQVGSASTYGHLLTLDSLLGLCQECVNTGTSCTLTVGSSNITKLSDIYVKLTGEPEADSSLPKIPMVQCESTDEGAMTINDYMALKNWSLA